MAIALPELKRCADWLTDSVRDVELQDIGKPAVMDGNWRAVARRSRALLSGHKGRVGVHAPFWNLSVGAIDPQIRAVVQARLHQGPVFADEVGRTLVTKNILDVNPAPLLALVASFGSPHVRLSIDVGHAHLMGARGAPPAAHWLAQGAGLPGHVHLQDNEGTTDAHLAPGGTCTGRAGCARCGPIHTTPG